ncbi:MAG: peptidylprolyl isomerase [Alphaproteobacteria bacterium]|nr:peptidylprolyl isomerase [Alphaproteobacteria bacterium]
MMLKIISLASVVALSLCLTSSLDAQESCRIAAVVNNVMITKGDLDARIKLTVISSGMEASEEAMREMRTQVLDLMIEEQLKIQEAEKFDVTVSDDMVSVSLAQIEQNNNMPDGELKRIFEQNDIPEDVMYNQIKASLVWRDFIRAKYGQIVQVGEDEIDRALKEIEDLTGFEKDQVAEIFLSVDDAKDDQKTYQEAKKFKDALKTGARFSMIAQQFSTAPSAARGGDIGWIKRGSLQKPLSDALATMKPGDVSEPIKTSEGYYLLMLRDQKAAGESLEHQKLITFKQLHVPVAAMTQEAVNAALTKARSFVNNARSCNLFSKLAQGDKSIKVQEMKDVPEGTVLPQLLDLLTKLEIDVPGEPILADVGVLAFVVCERREVDPKTPSREDIKNMLIEKKLGLLAQREVRNLKRASFTDIRL